MATITRVVTPLVGRCHRREVRRIFRRTSVNLFPPSPFSAVRFSSSKVSKFAAIETTPEYISSVEEVGPDNSILGCPVCYDPLIWNGESRLSIETTPGTTLQCKTCKKSYNSKDSLFDLTISSGSKNYVQSMPPVTEFFSTQAMSFLYERGWRQNFGLGGYPGPEREFEMAKEYFRPVFGGSIVDASCGSGLFSRRFAKSELFSLVVALDYSEAMLKQCLEFVKEDPDFPKEKLTLVRADISRLPFVSRTIDAVHAGAALHCWPSPSAAVAEISRVLRPGGVFVATTTIADGPFALLPFRGTFREYLQQYSGSRVFLSQRELRDLCTTCGLVDFRCTRNGLFVMICATKPS